jgi:hypothetical protein
MSSTHLDTVLNGTVRTILAAIDKHVNAIPIGTRVPAGKLSEEIGAEVDMTGPQVQPFMRLLLNGYEGFKVSRGAKGGIERLAPGTTSTIDTDTADTE